MKPSRLVETLVRLFSARLIPFIKGSPGLGKSAMVKQLAKRYNLKLIDIRLGQVDPTDLLGFPHMVNGRSTYAPPADIPLETDEIPDGYNGWLLFLDEFNVAGPAVQAAAYKLLDGHVGQSKIHPEVYMVCAGNKDTDGAVTNKLSTATISRIVTLEVEANLEDWIHWALPAGIDHRILGYLNFKPEMLHKFDPSNLRETFPCPRTWEMQSNDIIGHEVSAADLERMQGIIGRGAAREFIEYCQVYAHIATMEEILANPDGVEIMDRPDIKYAYATYVASNLKPNNASQLMKFILRLPVSFQIVSLAAAIKLNPALTQVPEIMDWVMKYGAQSAEGMI